ncbi:MAG: hypothetical protein WD648_08010 [Planctomycetaceae bacterium]
MLQEILTILVGSAILVGALTYLAKKLLTHWMDKDLQGHKARLEANNASELEKFRVQFRRN